ncbi:hypothetical protein KRP22_000207 [Phytophthora ramorum]|nr:DNA mismatch repair protein MSH5 [Phytophthora ramorum]
MAHGRAEQRDEEGLSEAASDVEVDDEELVFMSILFDRGELGVSIYNALTTSLKTLQLQIADAQELEEIIERLHTQFEVNHVLVSSRNASSNGMLRMVKKLDETHQTKTGVSVRKIQPLHRREVYTFLGSFFDFESTQLIRATGALLLYLSTEKIGNQLDNAESIHFSTVEHVALDGLMYIDKSTLQSLQIFNREAHPSLVKGSGRAKEGFSLFGLLNRTVTKSGGCMLRRWMLTPLVSSAHIDERLSAVAFFTAAKNDELRQLLFGKLKQFRDVAGIFQRIKRRCASVGDWCRFATSVGSFLETQSLIDSVCNDTSNASLPNVFSRALNEHGLIHVSNLLGNVVDFDESQQENTVIIRSGISEALDAARERYEDLDNVLTEVAFQIQETNPVLSSITVQYIPQVGYVICCDSPTTLPDFVFQFQEDDTTFYYKDGCCRDLDESIGDIYGYILDMQRELLEELTIAVLEYESSIHDTTGIMAYLDCLISFASCAKSFNFSRPQIIATNTLKATQARHPLQELLVEHYIPNDIFLDSSDSLKIVTGHNGSGKSVYLKMVGLLQYMAQIGCFVPAEKGVVTKMFTRIQSMESATVSQSSFTIDCNQMAWMLNHGDGRSLFLIDEFGKGTAELDGIALLSSLINYLSTKTFTHGRPRVILTTHFLEIFRDNLLEPSLVTNQPSPQGSGEQSETSDNAARVVCTVMASTEAPESYSTASNAVPLYELRHGISSHSNALASAAKCGIPEELVKRAQEVLDCTKRGTSIPSRQRSTGPSPEEQLASFFASIDDWQSAGDDLIVKFLAMARMGTQ